MIRKILLGSVTLLVIGTIIVIALLAPRVPPLLSGVTRGLDFKDVKVKMVGLEDIQVMAFLPLAQLFIGKAVPVEEAEIKIETGRVVTAEFEVTLPAGWGKVDEHTTENSVTLLLENEDGDFATVTAVDSPADPAQFIQDFIAQQNRMLELAGLTMNTYSTVTAGGYSAQAVDADGPGLAIRFRGWYDQEAQKVYLVALTSQPQNLLASQIILEGPSTGKAR